MGSLELLTWLAAGLVVGVAYDYFQRRDQDLRMWMPLLVGALGAFGAGWLVELLSPYAAEPTYRPALLAVAFVGAAVFVLGYHLYRVGAAPRATPLR